MSQPQKKIEIEEVETVSSSQELIVWEKLNPAELFKEGGLDSVLKEIDEKARSIILAGVETQKDRDNIRAIASKVSRTKTAVEKIGKAFTEPLRGAVKEANAERDKGIAFLQALQDDIREPLTEYEDAEKKREADADLSIERLSECAIFAEDHTPDSDTIKLRMDQLKLLYNNLSFVGFSEADEEKYNNRANHIYDRTKSTLETKFAERFIYEADKKELEELREKQATQEKKEEEGRIAKEAADKATADAEEKARIERESSEKAAADKLAAEQEKTRRIEAEKEEAERKAEEERSAKKAAEEKAEADKIEAEKQAQHDKEAAVQAEKDRAAAEKQRDREAAEKREANKKHRAKIDDKAAQGLFDIMENAKCSAEDVVKAIAEGKIPHVTIRY